MLIVLTGGGQDHVNPKEWRLRWNKKWGPEPPKWGWWDLLGMAAFLFWLFRR